MANTGGRFEVKEKGGKPVQVEGTKDHPDGNKPRPAQEGKAEAKPSASPEKKAAAPAADSSTEKQG